MRISLLLMMIMMLILSDSLLKPSRSKLVGLHSSSSGSMPQKTLQQDLEPDFCVPLSYLLG